MAIHNGAPPTQRLAPHRSRSLQPPPTKHSSVTTTTTTTTSSSLASSIPSTRSRMRPTRSSSRRAQSQQPTCASAAAPTFDRVPDSQPLDDDHDAYLHQRHSYQQHPPQSSVITISRDPTTAAQSSSSSQRTTPTKRALDPEHPTSAASHITPQKRASPLLANDPLVDRPHIPSPSDILASENTRAPPAYLLARLLQLAQSYLYPPPPLDPSAARAEPDISSATFYAGLAFCFSRHSIQARRVLADCLLRGGNDEVFPFSPSPLPSASSSSLSSAESAIHLLKKGPDRQFTDPESTRLYSRACQIIGTHAEARQALRWLSDRQARGAYLYTPSADDKLKPPHRLDPTLRSMASTSLDQGLLAAKGMDQDRAVALLGEARRHDPWAWKSWASLCDIDAAPETSQAFPESLCIDDDTLAALVRTPYPQQPGKTLTSEPGQPALEKQTLPAFPKQVATGAGFFTPAAARDTAEPSAGQEPQAGMGLFGGGACVQGSATGPSRCDPGAYSTPTHPSGQNGATRTLSLGLAVEPNASDSSRPAPPPQMINPGPSAISNKRIRTEQSARGTTAPGQTKPLALPPQSSAPASGSENAVRSARATGRTTQKPAGRSVGTLSNASTSVNIESFHNATYDAESQSTGSNDEKAGTVTKDGVRRSTRNTGMPPDNHPQPKGQHVWMRPKRNASRSTPPPATRTRATATASRAVAPSSTTTTSLSVSRPPSRVVNGSVAGANKAGGGGSIVGKVSSISSSSSSSSSTKSHGPRSTDSSSSVQSSFSDRDSKPGTATGRRAGGGIAPAVGRGTEPKPRPEAIALAKEAEKRAEEEAAAAAAAAALEAEKEMQKERQRQRERERENARIAAELAMAAAREGAKWKAVDLTILAFLRVMAEAYRLARRFEGAKAAVLLNSQQRLEALRRRREPTGREREAEMEILATAETFGTIPQWYRDSFFVRSLLGRLYHEMGEYREAEFHFSEARKHDPFAFTSMTNYSLALYHLNREVALSGLGMELKMIDPTSAASLIVAGNAFALQEEHSKALDLFERAILVSPGLAYAWTLAGYEALALDHLDQAMHLFRCAIREDRRHWNAWAGMGEVYLKMNKPAHAQFHYQSAADLNPQNGIIYDLLGTAYVQDAKPREALSAFAKALERLPSLAMTYYKRSSLLESMGRYEESHSDLLKAVELEPNDAHLHLSLAKSYMRIGGGEFASERQDFVKPRRYEAQICDHLCAAVDIDHNLVRLVNGLGGGVRSFLNRNLNGPVADSTVVTSFMGEEEGEAEEEEAEEVYEG
ncbi:TPR-like protein [Violaceomyces palustris]|uniref:TPR-like protein n=1 Tax=Violaceomyces palustris TaxID=1673888 RepID=A0ACD0NUD5_9BASI|nr:TPR-like protein [Violaceomyces palustris]